MTTLTKSATFTVALGDAELSDVERATIQKATQCTTLDEIARLDLGVDAGVQFSKEWQGIQQRTQR